MSSPVHLKPNTAQNSTVLSSWNLGKYAKTAAKVVLGVLGGGTVIATVYAASRQGATGVNFVGQDFEQLNGPNLFPLFSDNSEHLSHLRQKRSCSNGDACAFSTGTTKILTPSAIMYTQCLVGGPSGYFVGIADLNSNSYYGMNGSVALTPGVGGSGTLIAGSNTNVCAALPSGGYVSVLTYWTYKSTTGYLYSDTRLYNANGVYTSGRTDLILSNPTDATVQANLLPIPGSGNMAFCFIVPGIYPPTVWTTNGTSILTKEVLQANFGTTNTFASAIFANGNICIAVGNNVPQTLATIVDSTGANVIVPNTIIYNSYGPLSCAVLPSSQNIVFGWLSGNTPVIAQFQIYSSSLGIVSTVQIVNSCSSSVSDIQILPLENGGFAVSLVTASGVELSRFSSKGVAIDNPMYPLTNIVGTPSDLSIAPYSAQAVVLSFTNSTAIYISGPVVFDTAPVANASFSFQGLPNNKTSLNLAGAFINESPIVSASLSAPAGATYNLTSNLVTWTPSPAARGNGTIAQAIIHFLPLSQGRMETKFKYL